MEGPSGLNLEPTNYEFPAVTVEPWVRQARNSSPGIGGRRVMKYGHSRRSRLYEAFGEMFRPDQRFGRCTPDFVQVVNSVDVVRWE